MLTNKEPVVAPKQLNLKLDLGSGDFPRIGFESVDMFAPKATWKQNLCEFPWPWGDEQVLEIHCSHFIEHIPMLFYSEKDGTYSQMASEGSLDLLLRFFDECYRILVPGGKMTCYWPANRSDRAFQDPTHRRFIPPMTMAYLNKKWKEGNNLAHYLGKCNFSDGNGGIPSVVPLGMHPEFALYSLEAAARRTNESWNVVSDWQAILIKEQATI